MSNNIRTYIENVKSINTKQHELVSGTNIKTINNSSILGSGNIDISGIKYIGGDSISISNDNSSLKYFNLTGGISIAIGNNALMNATDTYGCTAIGIDALASLTTAHTCHAIGNGAGYAITTGHGNVLFGDWAGSSIISGLENVAIGTASMNSSTETVARNIAIGGGSLDKINTSFNTAIGHQALGTLGNTRTNTGDKNIAIGSSSAFFNKSSQYLSVWGNGISIGSDTKVTEGATNEIVIGTSAIGNGSNTVTIGNSTTTDTYLKGKVFGTFYGGLTGNAGTATTLQTSRTIGTSGDVTGTATSFNGSANITIPTTLANTGVTAGTYKSVTVDTKGRVTAGTNPTTLSGYGITDAVSHSELNTINGGIGLTGGWDIDLRNKTFTFTSTGSFVGSITTLYPDKIEGVINITSGITLDPSYNGKFIKIPKGTNSSTQDIYLIITNVTSNNSANIYSFSSLTKMPVPLTLFTNANLEVGDAIQSIIEFGGGDGTKYLADDGFYKPISSGSTYPLTFDDTNNNIIVGDKFNYTNTNHTTTNTLNVGSASFNNTAIIDNVVNLGLSNTFNGVVYRDSVLIGSAQNFMGDMMSSVAIGNNLNSSYGIPVNNSLTIGNALSAESNSIKIGIGNSIIRVNSFGMTLEGGYPNIFNGNSASATRLETARTINGVSFDGTSNITITDSTKQATLVSGTNIKTINGTSVLGSGDIVIQGGATLSNDTATNSSFYPVFTTSTSGSMTTASVSSTKLYFNPSTGTLNATQFNAFSDRNLKENINTIDNSLEIINKLNAVSFNWKETGRKSYGVIAQELEEVLPELVNTNDEGFKSVNYDGLIGILLAAVQALSKR